jgi:hypothetical protein
LILGTRAPSPGKLRETWRGLIFTGAIISNPDYS